MTSSNRISEKKLLPYIEKKRESKGTPQGIIRWATLQPIGIYRTEHKVIDTEIYRQLCFRCLWRGISPEGKTLKTLKTLKVSNVCSSVLICTRPAWPVTWRCEAKRCLDRQWNTKSHCALNLVFYKRLAFGSGPEEQWLPWPMWGALLFHQVRPKLEQKWDVQTRFISFYLLQLWDCLSILGTNMGKDF